MITNVSESVTYYATFKSDPTVYVYLTADDSATALGKVTGAGKYAAGKKKIALKATANKGYVFRGWYEGASVDLINDVPLTKAATYTLAEMPTNDVEYTAGFITANLDKSYIAATVNGMAFETTVGDGTPTLPDMVVTNGYIEADLFDAWQYNWKVEPWKTLIKPHDKKTTAYVIKSDGSFSESEEDLSLSLGADIAGRVTLKFAASGAVTASGEFVSGYDNKKAKYTTVKATGPATLVPSGDGHGLVFVYLSPKGLSVHTRCVTIPLSAE